MKLTWFITLLTYTLTCIADIKSTKGSIDFDINSDSNVEVRLNSKGLGIGVVPQAKLHVAGNALVPQKMVIGSSSSFSSNLHVVGSYSFNTTTINTQTILSETSHILADSSASSNLFIYLPSAGNSRGRIYSIKKVSASNNVVITGTENIDLRDSFWLSSGNRGSLKVMSDGNQWYILSTTGGESTNSPKIVSVQASDPNSDDYVLDNGDIITIVFDQATNQPSVSSASQINELFDFGDVSLGNNYTGSWSSSNTLVITLVDSTGASARIDDTITIKASANLMSAGITTKASSDSSAIAGNWGSFSPSGLGSLRLWLDGADLDGDGQVEDLSEAGLTGNLIDTWVDKSGGNTATAVTTERPALVPSTLNGNAVIRFDGTEDYFDFNEVDNIRSVFMVVKEVEAGNGFLLGHSSSYNFHRLTSSPHSMYHPSHSSTFVRNGDTYINGVEVDGLSVPMPTDYSVISIITTGDVEANQLSRDRSIATRYWNGDMAEVILYSDALSDEDRLTMEAYLAEKWGLDETVKIASIRADDLDNGDTVLSSGDNITIAFTLSTNQPNVSTKSNVDNLIDFEGYTFWDDYSGVWNSPSELVLTANGVGSGNLPIGGNIMIKASGNLEDIYTLFGTSTSSNAIQGNWGQSSDDLVQTIPLNYSDLELWYDGADLDGDGYRSGLDEFGLNGNILTEWADKSGNDNDGSIVGSPAYRELALNGNAVVFFDGSDDYINFNEIDNIRTAFWVVKEDTVDNNFLLGHPSTYHFHRGGSRIWNSTHAHANIKSGNTYVDGSLVNGSSTNLPSDYTIISVVTIGDVEAQRLSYDRSIFGRSWDGKVAELILYSAPLSDTDRQAIENYLREKWGTP